MSEIEQSEAEATEFGPDSLSPPICKHCGAGTDSLTRQRLQISQDGSIRRWKVRCKNCKRSCYLPHGQVLKRKPPPGRILTLDRPTCPSCGSRDVWRHDARRWSCRWCRRWFVTARKVRSDNTSGFNNVARHRDKWVARLPIAEKRFYLGSFNSPKLAAHANDEAARLYVDSPPQATSPILPLDDDPAEEAAALIKLFENGECKIAEIRELIAVTPGERRCLEFLMARGMLAATNVEPMLRFRDDVLRIFDGLVDAELAALACPPDEQRETTNNSDSQYQTGDELVTKDDR